MAEEPKAAAAPPAAAAAANNDKAAEVEESSKPETLKPRADDDNYSSLKSPTPGKQYQGVPSVPKSVQKKQALYSAGKPSKHDKAKLMRSEGIIPIQAGSNKYASQKGMTGVTFLNGIWLLI